MQGLVDFANQIGEVFGVLVPDVVLSGGALLFSVRRMGVLDAVASAKPFFSAARGSPSYRLCFAACLRVSTSS